MANWMNVLGDIGTVWGAAEQTNRQAAEADLRHQQQQIALETNRRNAEAAQMQLEEAKRVNERNKMVRDVMSGMGVTPDQPAFEVPLPNQLPNDDEGNAMPQATRTVSSVKGRPDLQRGYSEASKRLMQAGDWEGAQDFQKRAELYKQEGLLDLAKDLQSGRDHREAIREYNARGADRIDENTSQFDGKTLLINKNGQNIPFNPDQFLRRYGGQKADQYDIKDGVLLNKTTGDTRQVGTDKRAEEEHRSKLIEERTKRINEHKASIEKKTATGKGLTAFEKESQFIADSVFGGDLAAAIQYKMGSNDKPFSQRVKDMASLLKDFMPPGTQPDVLFAEAEKRVNGLEAKDVGTRRSVVNKSGGQQPAAAAPNAQETKVVDGKTYVKVNGQWGTLE
jgi:hypothetical protein